MVRHETAADPSSENWTCYIHGQLHPWYSYLANHFITVTTSCNQSPVVNLFE